MKILDLVSSDPTPDNFTGIIKDENGIYWFKEGKYHRLDGPAVKRGGGHEEWWIEGIYFSKIVLKDFVILDHDKGKYGLMWYKLLGKNNIFDCPDIPGLILY